MTVKQNELLSAFVDGEISEQELNELLAVLGTDERAKANYLRYQQLSDAMHGYISGRQPVDLSKRMAAAMAEEAPLKQATPQLPKAKLLSVPDWFWKQTAGLAAAASIGALAVVGVMNQSASVDMTTELASAQNSQASEPANRWTVGEDEVEERLNNYLVDHNEYAGASGLFSYARVVSYGEE